MIDEKIVSFLKLSKNEISAFQYLSNEPHKQISDISRVLKIPRMTVYLTLRSLKSRGLANFSRIGKRRFWSITNKSEIKTKIIDSVHSLTNTKEIRINANNSGFAIHQGLNGLYRVWEELQSLSPNSRVLGIQPTAAMSYALNKLDWQEKIAPLQENILKKPVIIDGVLQDNYYPYISQHYSHNKKLQIKMLESFLGRSTDMTFVSSEYFKNTESELFIMPDVAYLSDWKNEVSIEIRNRTMLTFLTELYILAKGYGKKVNQEEYIKEMISRLEKAKPTKKNDNNH